MSFSLSEGRLKASMSNANKTIRGDRKIPQKIKKTQNSIIDEKKRVMIACIILKSPSPLVYAYIVMYAKTEITEKTPARRRAFISILRSVVF